VACGAGDLVEQTSDLSGSQWTTSALYLQGISLVRRNSEWHHFDPLGTAQVITNNSASVISNNLYDVFGVLRYEQGSAQTPWRWKENPQGEEGLVTASGRDYIPRHALSLQAGGADLQKCIDACKRNYETCKMLADAQYAVDKANCEVTFAKIAAACHLFPHPPDRERCLRAAEAGKQLCLSQAAVKHARALQRCAEDLKKCIDDCTKDPGQPPEVREPVLPRLPRPFLPPGVSIGPVDGGFGIKWSFSF